MQHWIIGILGSMGAIVMASAVAWAGADQGALYDGVSVFVWCGVFAFSVQWPMQFWARSDFFTKCTGSHRSEAFLNEEELLVFEY